MLETVCQARGTEKRDAGWNALQAERTRSIPCLGAEEREAPHPVTINPQSPRKQPQAAQVHSQQEGPH